MYRGNYWPLAGYFVTTLGDEYDARRLPESRKKPDPFRKRQIAFGGLNLSDGNYLALKTSPPPPYFSPLLPHYRYYGGGLLLWYNIVSDSQLTTIYRYSRRRM